MCVEVSSTRGSEGASYCDIAELAPGALGVGGFGDDVELAITLQDVAGTYLVGLLLKASLQQAKQR